MLALALALPVAPVVTTTASAERASVAQVASHGDGKDRADKGKKKQKGKKAKKAKKASSKFNLGGSLTAVDTEAGTVTFRVRGGKFKAVRGTELTVVVGETARVRRNDAAATLADFQVGDKVRAKGSRVDGVWTANRVKAEAPDYVGDDDAGDDSGGSTDD